MMQRRTLIKAAGVGALASTMARAPAFTKTPRRKARPNILLLMTDQQCWNMMSCMGNRWLKTPAMDSIVAAGTRFDLTYVTNPVCSPSRFSLQTGRMPSVANISRNSDAWRGLVPEPLLKTSLGRLFHEAEYETVYGGKTHLPVAFEDELAGGAYRYIDADERGHLAETCAAYLRSHHDRPFFLTASFINPHDICFPAINAYLASRNRGSLSALDAAEPTIGELFKQIDSFGSRRDFIDSQCPPLPSNYGIPALEPQAISEQYLNTAQNAYRGYVREHWSDGDWRIYRWLYCRLIERVDAHIGTVLAALREANLESSTVIVFTSDHGDMNGAHRLEHKSVLYEESLRVPFVLSHKGHIPEGKVNTTDLVCNGLDLLPTLCDYALIEVPKAALYGRSVRPLVEGSSPASWRDFVVAENQHNRMIRKGHFKYCRYIGGANPEQLTDLAKDPGEMQNLAERAEYRNILADYRKLLQGWVTKTWDYDFMHREMNSEWASLKGMSSEQVRCR